MSNSTRSLGLDFHAEPLIAAIAEGCGRIRSLDKLPNRPEGVRKIVEKVGSGRHLDVGHQADPIGYTLFCQLTKLDVDC